MECSGRLFLAPAILEWKMVMVMVIVNRLSEVHGIINGMGSHQNEMDIEGVIRWSLQIAEEVAFSLEIDPCVRKPIIDCVYCLFIESLALIYLI